MKRLLVAGVGNIFLGDDGFGVEVVRQLGRHVMPEGVEVADFGIRAVDLGYALEDGYDAVILVDASPQGGAPGSLYVIEPNAVDALPRDEGRGPSVAPHDLSPTGVLQMARSMGGSCGHIVLVGCEPESFGTENDGEGRMGLSEPVAAAVDHAVRLIESLAVRLLQDDGSMSIRMAQAVAPTAGTIHLDGERR